MRCLSLTQPYAMLCVWVCTWHEGRPIAEKEYETRSFGCSWARNPKPEEIYIHAAKGFPTWAKELCRVNGPFRRVLLEHGYNDPDELPLMAIVGRVKIVGSLRTEDIRDRLAPQELAFGNYDDGRLAIRLSDPEPFEQIVHCKGMLGLWTVPAEIEAKIV